MKNCVNVLAFCFVVLCLTAAPCSAQNVILNGTINAVFGNNVRETGQSYSKALVEQIFVITSGVAFDSQFLITDVQNLESLNCNTGRINDYTTTVQGSGAKQGDTYTILESTVKETETGNKTGDFVVQGNNVAWNPNEFEDDYVYLEGQAGGQSVQSLYEIFTNSVNTLTVAGKLPPYDEIIKVTILADPGSFQPPNDFPTLILGTDSILTADGISLSINFEAKKGDKFPLNLVDPYIAILDPTGRLFFYSNKKWSQSVRPMYRGFFIGNDFDGVIGVFLLTPGMPLGAYTVYGVFNTPDASVFNRVFWRSNLARTQFFVQ